MTRVPWYYKKNSHRWSNKSGTPLLKAKRYDWDDVYFPKHKHKINYTWAKQP